MELHDADTWLTIKEAAARLGVHPATLRRWADEGQIPVMFTPGGHRRFAESDIDHFTEERRRLRVVAGLEQIWAEQALTMARKEIVSHQEQHWLSVFDEHEREQKRMLGRRLMGLLLQYVSSEGIEEAIMEQARAIGQAHAENAIQLGLPSRDALRASMFFRDAVVEAAMALPEKANVRQESNLHMLRRISLLLNAVQLSIVETYDRLERP
ncbi:MAG: helix-turn-helix domain-containing protein [Anaerolineales bacterium]|nr:helix-turn-helix domain-containing protein [Anaerolineales bacterium]